MMIFGFLYSCLFLVVIAYGLIYALNSAGKKLHRPTNYASAKEELEALEEQLGPMTWGERVFIVSFWVAFIIFMIWLVS